MLSGPTLITSFMHYFLLEQHLNYRMQHNTANNSQHLEIQ